MAIALELPTEKIAQFCRKGKAPFLFMTCYQNLQMVEVGVNLLFVW